MTATISRMSGDAEPIEMTYAEAADMARRYKALKEVESDVKRQLDAMNTVLREFIEKRGEPLDVEGLPVLRLKPRSTGRRWDSHAVETCHDKHPEEFRRLMAIGAVQFVDAVLKQALKNGNLAAIPEGATEGETWALVFDRER